MCRVCVCILLTCMKYVCVHVFVVGVCVLCICVSLYINHSRMLLYVVVFRACDAVIGFASNMCFVMLLLLC